MDPTYLSLIPPVAAVGLALLTRRVFISLTFGIWLGHVVLAGGPVTGTLGTVEGFAEVLTDAGNRRIVIFTLLIGVLIILIQASGGVAGFVARVLTYLDRKRAGRKRVEIFAALTGLLLFIESNISALTVGTLYRPLTDRLDIPREKIAYIADSTCAPSNILIPFNAWGAFVAGLLLEQDVANGFGVVLSSIAFNVYPILTIAIVFVVILTGRDIAGMKRAEARGTLLREGALPMMGDAALIDPETPKHKARNMLLPIAVLVVGVPLGLVLTGEGDGLFAMLQSGSGSRAVVYATLAAIAVALILIFAQGLIAPARTLTLSLRGAWALAPLAALMVLAFAIGAVCRELGTGQYVADQAARFLTPALVPAIVFAVGAFIAFSTGTSWGTFAIMIAIVVPLAEPFGLPLPLVVGAALGGGVFGDHCSPISDTTIVTSMATASDHIDHVRTQIPYALIAGIGAIAIYLVIGYLNA